MKMIMPDGRIFERIDETHIFTKSPLVILRGLTEYWIDGEPVEEEKFQKEIKAILEEMG